MSDRRQPNEELNLTGGLWQELARAARELHLIGSAGRLTPARYLDENLSDDEKQSGHTRLPQPEQEGEGRGKSAEQPYPGKEKRDQSDFERPDEFGDGDRRS